MTMDGAAPALRLTGVTCRFGGVTAVASVSLEVPAGARHGIIGPNGAGKTTLFNAISGETAATEGRVELFGRDVTRLGPARRVGLGLGRTYQITRTFASLTVRENLTLAVHGLRRSKFAMLRPWSRYHAEGARAEALAERLQLERRLDDRASELSHGEVRQLEVALALALDPRVLLLDEPGAGLSPEERGNMGALLRELPADLTLVMIEHDMDLVRDVMRHIHVLDHGQVVTDGDTATVQADPRVREIYLGASA